MGAIEKPLSLYQAGCYATGRFSDPARPGLPTQPSQPTSVIDTSTQMLLPC